MSAGGFGRRSMRPVAGSCVLLVLSLGILIACAPAGPSASGSGVDTAVEDAGRSARPGTTPVALELLRVYENRADAFYYPLDGVAGCAYTANGTLLVCDEKRGKVYALDPRDLSWYEFDHPGVRPYRPVDALADGFKVLVLDAANGDVYRFDMNGAWLDLTLELDQVDPASRAQANAFAMDRDGRMIVADAAEQQVLLLDTFLQLHMRIGGPGTLDDQFENPAGLAFLVDGGFVVSDQGNRRLCRYGRSGFFEGSVGGAFAIDNPFVAPQGLDTDRYGNLFVADAGNGLIHVLDRRQRLLFSAGRDFGIQGTPLGPIDVAVGPDDTLAVVDRVRSAVLVYRLIYD